MKRLKNILLGLAFIVFVATPIAVLTSPQTVLAAPPVNPEDCSRGILGMPTWFRGLVKVENSECIIVSPNSPDPNDEAKMLDLAGFIWRIALNVIEIGLFIVGYVALFFVLYGGFQFLTGGSNPGQIEKARMTLLNAVIGLAISIASIAIVNLIFGVIG